MAIVPPYSSSHNKIYQTYLNLKEAQYDLENNFKKIEHLPRTNQTFKKSRKIVVPIETVEYELYNYLGITEAYSEEDIALSGESIDNYVRQDLFLEERYSFKYPYMSFPIKKGQTPSSIISGTSNSLWQKDRSIYISEGVLTFTDVPKWAINFFRCVPVLTKDTDFSYFTRWVAYKDDIDTPGYNFEFYGIIDSDIIEQELKVNLYFYNERVFNVIQPNTSKNKF